MLTPTPNLPTAGSVLPARQDAACGGIGGPAPSSLCTLLPPAEPSHDTTPCWHFVSADFQEYVADHELAAFHQLFQAAGTPYTVQHQPIHLIEPDDHLDWYTHPALTPSQRNSLSF